MNMLKRFVASMAAAGMLFVATFSSFAAGSLSFNANFDPETGNVTLTGSANGDVTVRIGRVPSDGSEPADLFTAENPPVVFDKIDADGEFTYICILPDGTPGGQYKIYLREGDSLKTDTFSFYDVAAAERDIIPLLNEAIVDEDFAEFSTVIKKSPEDLGIDSADSVYKSKSSMIIELLYNCNDSFASAPDFYNKYYEMYAVSAISGANQAETEDVMGKYASYLNIDFAADYKNESRLTASAKSVLCNLLGKYDYTAALPSGESFDEILASLKPVASVSSASKWQDLNSAMTVDYKEDFAFIYEENTEHKSLSSLTQVYSKMMADAEKFNSLEDVQASFDAAVKAVIKSNTSSSPGGGSSGGSSGGFGGSAVTMPKDDNEIAANPTPAPVQMFSDVSSDYWGFEAINELAKSKAINGYVDGSYKPEGLITRAEFIKIIVLLAGYELSDSDFTDVENSAWYSRYVGAAAKAGIAQGADGRFNPENSITRQDAATIIYRVLSDRNVEFSEGKSFTDADAISDYAKEAITALSSIRIINGYTTGEFKPLGNITRAEAAQMLYNAKPYIS